MFYRQPPEQNLRFGDIVRGFPVLWSVLQKPPLCTESLFYTLEVDIPQYAVVLTPCCSIRHNVVSVCPLKKVDPTFFRNPFFLQDLTSINRRMRAEEAATPAEWEHLSEIDKKRRESEGEVYALISHFIYAPDKSLSQYTLTAGKKDEIIGHYMIDFRDVFRVRYKMPPNVAEIKILQLDVHTRHELRLKIAEYYYRPPEEDRLLLD